MKLTDTQPDNLKIQISPERRIADMLTLWPDAGPEVDIVMDPRAPYGLRLRPGSVKVLYAFGILGRTDPDRVQETVNSFFKALAPQGELYIIEPSFDYITRSAVGGDIGPEEFAKQFSRKSYFTLQNLAEILRLGGTPVEKQIIWNDAAHLKFNRHHYEVIVTGRKINA